MKILNILYCFATPWAKANQMVKIQIRIERMLL